MGPEDGERKERGHHSKPLLKRKKRRGDEFLSLSKCVFKIIPENKAEFLQAGLREENQKRDRKQQSRKNKQSRKDYKNRKSAGSSSL